MNTSPISNRTERLGCHTSTPTGSILTPLLRAWCKYAALHLEKYPPYFPRAASVVKGPSQTRIQSKGKILQVNSTVYHNGNVQNCLLRQLLLVLLLFFSLAFLCSVASKTRKVDCLRVVICTSVPVSS